MKAEKIVLVSLKNSLQFCCHIKVGTTMVSIKNAMYITMIIVRCIDCNSKKIITTIDIHVIQMETQVSSQCAITLQH